MAKITTLDEFRSRLIPIATLELRDNPALVEVVAPLWPEAEDDPDDVA
jgi:hypothetical protein